MKKESGGSIEGFASEIRDVRLTDYDQTGFTELLVTTGDDARLLWSSTLIQKLIVDVPEGEDVVVAFGMTPQDAEDNTNHLYATVINGTYVTSSGVVEESMELRWRSRHRRHSNHHRSSHQPLADGSPLRAQ